MTIVMIHMRNTPMQFWAKAINTTYYTTNRIFLRPETKKTSYELWIRRKFYVKFDVGIFLGYFTMSKSYRVYNQNS